MIKNFFDSINISYKEEVSLRNYNTYRVNTNMREDSVSMSAEMVIALNNNNSTKFTSIHNHPTDSNFYIDDLTQFILYSKMNLMILCTNSCKHSAALFKSQTIDSDTANNILIDISNYKINNNVDGHGDAMTLIQKYVSVGLLYFVRNNY